MTLKMKLLVTELVTVKENVLETVAIQETAIMNVSVVMVVLEILNMMELKNDTVTIETMDAIVNAVTVKFTAIVLIDIPIEGATMTVIADLTIPVTIAIVVTVVVDMVALDRGHQLKSLLIVSSI